MASVIKTDNGYRAQVYVKGKRDSQCFRTKREAETWAAAKEVEFRSEVRGTVPDKSFGQLLEKYRDEVSANKRGSRWEVVRINKFLRSPLAPVRLASLDATHFARWRDESLKELAPASVRREWNLLSSVCSTAVREWRWLKSNPMSELKRPEAPPARDRRITAEEIERLLFALGYSRDVPPTTMTARVGAAFLFAIETAMRAGEIVGLKWGDVELERRFVRITEGKTRAAQREVPLSQEAVRILHQLDRNSDTVFQLKSATLDALFRKAKSKALLDDLHFHDTRHEGITRLASKLDVLPLARAIGHRDLKMLLVYYNESAEDLAKRLWKKAPETGSTGANVPQER